MLLLLTASSFRTINSSKTSIATARSLARVCHCSNSLRSATACHGIPNWDSKKRRKIKCEKNWKSYWKFWDRHASLPNNKCKHYLELHQSLWLDVRRLPKIFWPCRAPLHKAVWEAPWAPQVPPPPSSFSAMFYNILQLCVIVRENGHVRLAGPLQSLQGKHSKHRKIILQVLRSRHDHLTTPAIQCARNYDVFQRTATSKYATIGHSIL